jgi:inorganic pyrophosphatase
MDLLTQKNGMGKPLLVEVVIEVPKGSFLKRCSDGKLDFLSPVPCPFNYGSVDAYTGLDGDLLDAVVLGPRLPRGARRMVPVVGAVRLTDRGMPDDKLVCSDRPVGKTKRALILLFFRFYAKCKGVLNVCRGYSGRNRCSGWFDGKNAIERATRNDKTPG